MPKRPEIVRCSEVTPCTYRQLFDAVDDILYIRDLAGIILDINEAGVRFFGKPKTLIVGRTFHATPVDERAMSLMETNLSLLESGHDRSVVLLTNAAGQSLEFEVTTTVIRDASGSPVGAFGVMRDVRPVRQIRPNTPQQVASTMKIDSGRAAPAVVPRAEPALQFGTGGLDLDAPTSGSSGWMPAEPNGDPRDR